VLAQGNAAEQIVGPERRQPVSHQTWYSDGCMVTRRPVNSNVMRLTNSFIFLLAIVPLFASAQTIAPQDRKFDEFTIMSDFAIDDMKARLDDLYRVVSSQNESRAYVFVYAGKRGYSKRYTVRNIRDYLGLRGLSSNRVIVTRGGRRNVPMVELWIVPSTAIAPKASPPFSPGRSQRR
jgi:hypothetical protein